MKVVTVAMLWTTIVEMGGKAEFKKNVVELFF